METHCSNACVLHPYIPGVWGCWTETSSCSVSCGEGMRSRTRQCHSLPPGKPFTIPCAGHSDDFIPCDMGPCISNYMSRLMRYCFLSHMRTANLVFKVRKNAIIRTIQSSTTPDRIGT